MSELLLKILNWLENSPAYYGRIENTENFSREFIESFRGKTVKQMLDVCEKMEKCGENCVISKDGTTKVNDLSDYI